MDESTFSLEVAFEQFRRCCVAYGYPRDSGRYETSDLLLVDLHTKFDELVKLTSPSNLIQLALASKEAWVEFAVAVRVSEYEREKTIHILRRLQDLKTWSVVSSDAMLMLATLPAQPE
jgi:hypothetical protein